MFNFDDYANENKMEHNSKWRYVLDRLYRILINALLNLRNNRPIDKIYLYAKDPYESKYRFFYKKSLFLPDSRLS